MANILFDFNLLEQIAVLIWAHSGNSHMAEKLAAIKLAGSLWNKFSGEDEMERLRMETILSISKFIKDNPRASQDEVSREVGKQITEFAKKVGNM